MSYSKIQFTLILITAFLFTGCQSLPPAQTSTLEQIQPLPTFTKTSRPASTQAQQLIIPQAALKSAQPQKTLSSQTPAPTQESSPTQDFSPTHTPTIDPIKPILDAFIDTIKTGNPDEVVGVHVEDVMMLKVIQQPPGDYSYVTDFDGEATEFILAYEVAGNLGLIAHNYLSGASFFDLTPGNIVQIIYGDGNVKDYIIGEIYEYQAVNPYSTTSDFISLDANERISATNLFYKVYGGKDHHLTFQTCIEQNGNPVWGRFFAVSPEL